MSKPRILVFGGSLRAESFNQKLATIAAAKPPALPAAEVTLISLRDFRMPLFDEDLEAAEGMPEAAQRLKALFAKHDGLIIASPEYNSTHHRRAQERDRLGVPGRHRRRKQPLSVLKGKSAAILSASPGGYGGARSLAALRPFLENIQHHGAAGPGLDSEGATRRSMPTEN